MRKTLLYLVILAILGLGIYYFIFTGPGNPYSVKEAGFTVKDTSNVGKIFLATNNGETILVERTDSGWIVNKKYRALQSTVNTLLETIHLQEAQFPVTHAAHDNVVKEMSTDGIKTEVYDRKGNKISVFYVGGTGPTGKGTYMMMDGASQPYLVQIPAFNGYLSSRYSTQLRAWRDRTVFNLPAEEIKTISVQYEGKPLNSFVLAKDGNKYSVTGDPRITNTHDTLNTRKCNVYTHYFSNVNCEGFLNGLNDLKQSISTAHRQSSIDITGIHGQHQHIDIYWLAINKRSKNLATSNPDVPDDYDADRLYGVVNNAQDTVLVQLFVFNKIFRQAADFYMPDDPNAAQGIPHPNNVIMHKPQ